MRPELKTRILRVAEAMKVFRYYEDLVKNMAQFSNAWNATAEEMKKGLETRDVDLLARAIRENRKQAQRLSYVLERHERLVSNLGAKNET